MLYHDVKDLQNVLTEPVVVIGNFDGVHVGHQALIQRAADEGEEVVVLTFDPHPVQYFRRDSSPFLLSTIEERSAALHAAGATHVVAITFNDEFANVEARSFVQGILHERLRARTVIVGQQFAFGRGRAGNLALLETMGQELGFETIGIDLVQWESERASSTRIRDAIRTADLQRANEMLGRLYSVSGPIVHGDGRGDGLGFPTANIEVPRDRLLPPAGIYASQLVVDDLIYDAATYVGSKPTFVGDQIVVESFVLDAPDEFDLYGKVAAVRFFQRVREDRKFDSVDGLVAQMRIDVDHVREILS